MDTYHWQSLSIRLPHQVPYCAKDSTKMWHACKHLPIFIVLHTSILTLHLFIFDNVSYQLWHESGDSWTVWETAKFGTPKNELFCNLGGTPWNFWWGSAVRFLIQTLSLFQSKIYYSPNPSSHVAIEICTLLISDLPWTGFRSHNTQESSIKCTTLWGLFFTSHCFVGSLIPHKSQERYTYFSTVAIDNHTLF